jgi:hypothetical protein
MSLLCLAVNVAIALSMYGFRTEFGTSSTSSDHNIACDGNGTLSSDFDVAVAPWLLPCKCFATEDMPWQTTSAGNTASDTIVGPLKSSEDPLQCPPDAAPMIFTPLSTRGQTTHSLDTAHVKGPTVTIPCRGSWSVLCRLEQPAVLVLLFQAARIQNDTVVSLFGPDYQAVAASARLNTSAPLSMIDQTLPALATPVLTAPASPLASWFEVIGHTTHLQSDDLCKPGSSPQSAQAAEPWGPNHIKQTRAHDAIGTKAQTQLLVNQQSIPDDKHDEPACAPDSSCASDTGLRAAPHALEYCDMLRNARTRPAAVTNWALYLLYGTLATAAAALACVGLAVSACVFCAAAFFVDCVHKVCLQR